MKTFRFPILFCLLAVSGCMDNGPYEPAPPDRVRRLERMTNGWTLGITGSEVTAPPEVRVVDQFGASVPGELVTFVLVSGGGAIEGATVISDANGRARLGRWILGDEPGENIVNARMASSPAAIVDFRVTARQPCAAPCGGVRRVAFVRQGNIHVADPDGSNVVQLTSGGTFADPAWSTDGSHIAFTDESTGGDSQIYLIRADGSALRRFAEGFQPAWSPDGERIAYAAFHENRWAIFVKYVSDADAPALPIVTSPGYNYAPTWSPGGDKIAFVSDRAAPGDVSDVYLVNPDGSGIVRITGSGSEPSFTAYHQPVWSPDGLTLAVISCDTRQYVECAASRVAIIPRDGQGYLTLAETNGFARPGWMSDGYAVTFSRPCVDYGCPTRVFLKSIHGGSEHLLMTDAASLACVRSPAQRDVGRALDAPRTC